MTIKLWGLKIIGKSICPASFARPLYLQRINNVIGPEVSPGKSFGENEMQSSQGEEI